MEVYESQTRTEKILHQTNQRREKRADEIEKAIHLQINNKKIKTAIDYGCGEGNIGLKLAYCFDKLTLIDSSQDKINTLREKLKTADKQQCEISLECLDFIRDGINGITADCIITSLVLHHIEKTKDILSCFFDVLNNDGWLFVIELDEDDGRYHEYNEKSTIYNGFKRVDMEIIANEIGFECVKSETLLYAIENEDDEKTPYSYFIMTARKRFY